MEDSGVKIVLTHYSLDFNFYVRLIIVRIFTNCLIIGFDNGDKTNNVFDLIVSWVQEQLR